MEGGRAFWQQYDKKMVRTRKTIRRRVKRAPRHKTKAIRLKPITKDIPQCGSLIFDKHAGRYFEDAETYRSRLKLLEYGKIRLELHIDSHSAKHLVDTLISKYGNIASSVTMEDMEDAWSIKQPEGIKARLRLSKQERRRMSVHTKSMGPSGGHIEFKTNGKAPHGTV